MNLTPASPASGNPPSKARYIMIGGFLGAGKTTSVSRLARHLSDQGLRVGLITNDQGSELVDTATLRSRGFATEEIPGGCFCCRFNSLVDAARKLTAASRPDVFVAEPVGSCTDLVATVTYPLRRMYGDDFTIAPLSVVVDPIRALRVLGLESGGKFSEKVLYIYRKQLEEADILVINKCDSIDVPRREALRSALGKEFPGSPVLEVSARTGEGLAEWFRQLTESEQTQEQAMNVDYEIYAEGEALLGWLNCSVEASMEVGFDGNVVVHEIASELHQLLKSQGAEVAHLKLTLSPDEDFGDIAVANLVRNDFHPEMSQRLQEELRRGELIINLRAEAAPELLEKSVETAIETVKANHPGLRLVVHHLERFRPGKPQPTHRVADPVSTT